MSITPTFPGVSITEVPSGDRTLTGVATSITAVVVGRTSRGPLDEPVPMDNFPDFGRAIGGWSRDSGRELAAAGKRPVEPAHVRAATRWELAKIGRSSPQARQ